MDYWYNDKTINAISEACDVAYYSDDKVKMEQLIEKCYSQGHDISNSPMVRAKYLYNAFTVLGDSIKSRMREKAEVSCGLSMRKAYETDYEKCFYLVRTAFDLVKQEAEKIEEMSKIERIYFKTFCFQMIVNYTNFLYENGRIVKAIELLSIFAQVSFPKVSFPMGTGNLGMKLFEFSKLHYDSNQQPILLHRAYQFIQGTLELPYEYIEAEELTPVLEKYSNSIMKMLGREYLVHEYTIEDFLKPSKKMSAAEKDYRAWMARHKLALNLLNDAFAEPMVGYDPLHLPSIIGDEHVLYLQGLFNQIKQEYVSARFFAYEGLTKRKTHFSDKKVMLINTLDYPVYGLAIEKVKAAYRAIYSLFDKVAYFLNEYFELGLERGKVSYYRVWSPEKTKGDTKKLIDITDRNYPLFGMWWLFKDIRNIQVSNTDKYVDPVMSQISKIRNAMEHTYLKVLDTKMMVFSEGRKDELAYNISFLDFEKSIISLLKYAREAIILLVLSVKSEEERKEESLTLDKSVMSMYTDKYEDEWKQIFD